jgi:hypothetical protein
LFHTVKRVIYQAPMSSSSVSRRLCLWKILFRKPHPTPTPPPPPFLPHVNQIKSHSSSLCVNLAFTLLQLCRVNSP